MDTIFVQNYVTGKYGVLFIIYTLHNTKKNIKATYFLVPKFMVITTFLKSNYEINIVLRLYPKWALY